MESRLYGAVRLSYPSARAQVAVLQVFAVGIFLVYPASVLYALLYKHSRRFPRIYSAKVIAVARESISLGGARGAIRACEASLSWFS